MPTAHSAETESVLERLETDPGSGLDSEEARRRLDEIGPNRLPEPPKPNVVIRFLKHFNNFLIYVLLAAAVVTALTGHYIDSIVIFAVAVINAGIGFVQEGRADAALQGLRNMLSPEATVRRDGKWSDVDAHDIVPGDIVKLTAGDRVPADVRLLSSSELRIEESALTGESEPAEKSTDPVDEDAGVGDRTSMAYSGSTVSAGSATAVVTATATDTEIGRISDMLTDVESVATPLTRSMDRFGKLLTLIIAVASVALFLFGWLVHNTAAEEMFQASIAFAVSAVPEGLPAIMTITLARGVQIMAKRNAITRKLNSIETLGSVSVICSDKTGTLTANEMTARAVVTAEQRYGVEGQGYEPEGHIMLDDQEIDAREHEDLWELLEVMSVANDTSLRQDDDAQWIITGEPTEGALVSLARKAGLEESDYQRLDEIPFNSDNKFMAVLARDPEGNKRVMIKGAPDRLVELCDDVDHDQWKGVVKELSDDGLRVLAAAVRDTDDDGLNNEPGSGFRWLGVVGIADPPRPEAIEAIKLCRQAGISVKMITGDHIGTAEAIGREMELDDEVRSITGSELEKLSDEELREVAVSHNVFARTSPEHKLRLVKALQASGEVVAMTGDGVNDAPALRRADVGVAMGIKGTEVTKEAADVVLADDNFSSIERAVEEGRTIYDNLRKSILFMLPTNGGEALVIIAAVVMGITLPLSPLQILWVNMVVAVSLAFALAYEPGEPGLMQRPPRDPNTSVLDGRFLWRVVFVSILLGGATLGVFMWFYEGGEALDLARSLTVNVLVLGQIFYLFNVRVLGASSLRPRTLFDNKVAWICIAICLGLQSVFLYAPFMNSLFGSVPLGWEHWAISVGIGLGILLLVELEKLVIRRVRD